VPKLPPHYGRRYEFHRDYGLRDDIVDRTRADARRHSGQELLVHMCFTCDPYIHGGSNKETRHVIRALKEYGHHVQILTKGGLESTWDLGFMDSGDEYATTLTCPDEDARLWEPHAAPPSERLSALDIMSRVCPTWVSLEPVIVPEWSLEMLGRAIGAGISKVKVGPLNYADKLPAWLATQVPENVDWRGFTRELTDMCARSGVQAVLKNDLKELL
jgi:DNA repair photolyase